MQLFELSDIEKELRETSDLACDYGLNVFLKQTGKSKEDLLSISDAERAIFINYCHEGFKQAQEKIIAVLLQIQTERDLLKAALSISNKNKEKERSDVLKIKLKHLEYVEHLFYHVADTIVWQLIKGQLYVARRLYQKVKGYKKLNSSNLKSVKKIAGAINEKIENFALVTDITTNVQTGDIIGIIDGKFSIIEVKEGEKNFEVLEIIKELNLKNTSINEIEEKYETKPEFIQQIKRNIKQATVMQNVVEILNTDKGTDPITKGDIKIITPLEPQQLYVDRLIKLQKQLEKNDTWAYDVIEDCLHVGMYKGKYRLGAHLILKGIAENSGSKNYIILDFIRVINSIHKPIFITPFDKEFIFDLIFKRAKIYFLLEIDPFLELYKKFGFTAEWGTKKETAKFIQEYKQSETFILNHRGIKISTDKKNEKEIWLATGTITKMLFEHQLPSYIAYSTRYFI